jgi:GAF domain-containing protein
VPSPRSFLDLLYEGAPPAAFDALLAEARAAAGSGEERAALQDQHALALRLREQMLGQRRREAELTALYETAQDLIAIRDVDTILAAIVRRARQLLGADMAYLSLNDEEEGASYMKVTDGSVSAEFRTLRLPLGTGLLGLVAQTGAPYYTDDYQHDQRFKHREYIDHAVNDERIRAILGVPLIVEGKVIGALLAGHRSVRPFPADEVSLLTSFAAHAAVALENARLFSETQTALAEVDEANRQMREHTRAVELAAQAHDRLTDVLLHGGGVDQVADTLADVLDGELWVCEPDGRQVAAVGGAPPPPDELTAAVADSVGSGRSIVTYGTEPLYVAACIAGAEHLGTVVLRPRAGGLDTAQRRTLERGAVVTALILLFNRSVAAAEDRVREELLNDLLSGREVAPARLRQRVRRHRVDLDRLGAVAVADVGPGDRHRAAQAASRLGGELGGLGGEHEGHIVLVAPSDEPVATGELLRERLAGVADSATVGVARVARRGDAVAPAALATAWGTARSCLLTLATLGRAGEVSDPAGLGMARLVLGSSGPEELDDYLEGTLGPLLRYDAQRGTDLVGTLEAWFAAGGRANRAAEALHLHPNTVAQRLERIGSLLGPDWREPGPALEQQLALRLWRLRHRPL